MHGFHRNEPQGRGLQVTGARSTAVACMFVIVLPLSEINDNNNIFQLIALENLGAFSSSSFEFLRELGRRLGSLSGEDREACFLFQRLSVAIQRFNVVLLHNGFTDDIPDL